MKRWWMAAIEAVLPVATTQWLQHNKIFKSEQSTSGSNQPAPIMQQLQFVAKVAMINWQQENCNRNEKKPVVTGGDKSSNSNGLWQKLQPSQHSDCNRVISNNEPVTMIKHQQ